jgi:threonine dehydratase/serine racemase
MPPDAPTFADVQEAAQRIAPWAHRTPVMTCSTLDRLAGACLFFKCEQFQKAGAFKFRGACSAVMKLPEDAAGPGVVTHSSGNHAQALALAARIRGVPAHIVMPSTASPVKRRAVEEYGGRIVLCEPTLKAREATAAQVQQETGAVLIPPYDHPDVIAGQGTAALELIEQVDNLDAIIAPVGGGGLMSGVCLAARAMNSGIRLFGAEPAGADDAFRSLKAGRLIPQTEPRTIADGLLTSLGELTWPILRDHLEEIITVTDKEIIAAMRLAWERAKFLIEPSAAAPLAAVLREFASQRNLARIGVILSGGNANLDQLPWGKTPKK